MTDENKWVNQEFSPRFVYLRTKIHNGKERNPIDIYMEENNISIDPSFICNDGRNSKYPPELTFTKMRKLRSAGKDTSVDANSVKAFCKYYNLDFNEIVNHVKTYVRYVFDDNED